MMMSKSQAQQTSSPLFLDDEETDLEDTLPFDRCIKADEEFEEELEDKEVEMDRMEFLHQLPSLKTSKFESKQEVLSWVGNKNILQWIWSKYLIPIIGIIISAVILIVACFNPLGLSGWVFEGTIASIVFLFIFSSIFFWVWGSDVSNVGFIQNKLDSEDYLIANYVVDCPAMVKIDLYEDIKYNKELYVRYVPQKQELQFFTNGGEVSYYWVEKSTDKNSFDYQMYYFAKQLIPHNFYRISDIVTDKAPRNTNKVYK